MLQSCFRTAPLSLPQDLPTSTRDFDFRSFGIGGIQILLSARGAAHTLSAYHLALLLDSSGQQLLEIKLTSDPLVLWQYDHLPDSVSIDSKCSVRT